MVDITAIQTANQAAQLANFAAMVREAATSLRSLVALSARIDAQWTASVSAIVGTPKGQPLSLPAQLGRPLPTMTDTQLSDLVVIFQAIATAYGDAVHQQQLSAVTTGSGNPGPRRSFMKE